MFQIHTINRLGTLMGYISIQKSSNRKGQNKCAGLGFFFSSISFLCASSGITGFFTHHMF